MMKPDWPLIVMLGIALSFVSYSIWFRGEREYTPSFWIEDKVVSYKCKSTRSGVHSIKLKNFKGVVLVAINGLNCQDILSLAESQNVQIKISYGYDTVPYTFEIVSHKKKYLHKNGEKMFSSNKYFDPIEGLLFIGFTLIILARAFKLIRKTREI